MACANTISLICYPDEDTHVVAIAVGAGAGVAVLLAIGTAVGMFCLCFYYPHRWLSHP